MASGYLQYNFLEANSTVLGANTTGPASMTVQLTPPLQLLENTKIALSFAAITYFFPNVSAAQNNNTFSWNSTGPLGTTGATVLIPDGAYDIDGFNTLLQTSMYNAGVAPTNSAQPYGLTFTSFPWAGRAEIVVTKNVPVSGQSYSITIPGTGSPSLANLLGINAGTYTSTIIGQNYANINNGIVNAQIHCDLAVGAYNNSNISDLIYTFTPASGNIPVAVSGTITLEPPNYKYVNTNTSQVSSIRFYLTDQSGNPLSLGGQPWTIDLAFFEPIGGVKYR